MRTVPPRAAKPRCIHSAQRDGGAPTQPRKALKLRNSYAPCLRVATSRPDGGYQYRIGFHLPRRSRFALIMDGYTEKLWLLR